MNGIDEAKLLAVLANDGEFARAARQWTGSFAFADEGSALRIEVVGGRPARVSVAAAQPVADVVFTGPSAGWTRVFAAVPPPFYQDLVGGAVGRHGFSVSGDLLAMSAHYGAIQRAAQLVGAVARGEEAR